jgi:hypothetical protein
MDYINWLEQEAALSSAGLTVRAQTIDPTDNGTLVWDTLFPRVEADSLDLATITDVEVRPVSDRREMNAPGRLIPITTPDLGKVSMTPIEAYHLVDEAELYRLRVQTGGNAQLFRERMAAPIPRRADVLVAANYRRIEVDAMTAWALGQITVRNPQLGHSTTASFQFAAGRYQTAVTPWDDPGVNAYDEFLAWLEEGIQEVGPIRGVMLPRVDARVIAKAAPVSQYGAPKLTLAQTEERLRDDLGAEFSFYFNDNTVGIFGDAGTQMTQTRVWPVNRIAAIPQNGLGNTHFAPVVRAMDLAAAVPDAGIDVRGQTVYYLPHNDSKELKLQAQVNALTVPSEQRVWVMNTGIV